MSTYLTNRMATQIHTPPMRDEDVDVRTLLGTLGDYKRLILFGTVGFFIASVLYVLLATPKYEANAVVQVERRTPTVPGLSIDPATQAPAAHDSPATTEIQLLTSRHVLGEAVRNLELDIQAKPARFPVIGDFVARNYQPDRPGAVAAPWFGLSRYGWGGEQLQIARLDVPDELVGAPLQLVAGERGRYTLFDGDGVPLVNGVVGKAVTGRGVTALLQTLHANPGMRFEVKRLNTLAILDQLKQDISAVEQGRDSGIITLRYANTDPLLAKRVLEHISRTYVTQNVERNSAEAAKRLEFVKEQLPKVRDELAKAQAELNTFQTRTQTHGCHAAEQGVARPDHRAGQQHPAAAHPAGGHRRALHARASHLPGAARSRSAASSAKSRPCKGASRNCPMPSRACSG